MLQTTTKKKAATRSTKTSKKAAKKAAKKVAKRYKKASKKANKAVKQLRSSVKPSGTRDKVIEIPALEIRALEITVEALTPLVVNRWSEKAKKWILDSHMGKAKTKLPPKVPEDDFEAAKYLNAKGQDCINTLFFKKAIVAAARFAGNDVKMTVLRGSVFTRPPKGVCTGDPRVSTGSLVPLKFSSCEMREDMVRVGGALKGKPDVRFRPQYNDWSCTFVIEYNASMLTDEQIVNLIRLAGFSEGICEWRPSCDGDFGRFAIASVREAGVRSV